MSSSPFVPGPRPSNSSDDSTFVCASTASMSTSGSWPIEYADGRSGPGGASRIAAGLEPEHAAVPAIASSDEQAQRSLMRTSACYAGGRSTVHRSRLNGVHRFQSIDATTIGHARLSNRGHRRRRHRQGSHSGRPGGDRGGGARQRRVASVHRAAVGLRLLPETSRTDDGRGRLRAAGAVRRHLSRRDRRASRARSHRRRATDSAAAAALRAVREPAADAAAAGLDSPLANRGAADIDMVCVRENSEGEYAGVGGRIHVGTPHEVARADRPLHAPRHRTHPALRLRGRREAAAQAAGQRDQVERAAPRDGAVGRGRGDRARRTIPTVEYRKYHVDAHRRADGHPSAARST